MAGADHAPMAHPAVRAIDEAAEALRARLSLYELGRRVGAAHTTILRREHLSVLDWPARDLLAIALSEPELAQAIAHALAGRPAPAGDGGRVATDLISEAETSEHLAVEVRRALADGHLDRREIDRLLDALASRQAADRALVTDLRAAARTAR